MCIPVTRVAGQWFVRAGFPMGWEVVMWWVEVLNRALEWSHFEKARELARAAGADLSAAAHGRLVAEVALLRRAAAARLLGRQPLAQDEQTLLQWLRAVTLSLAVTDDSASNTADRLLAVRGSSALPPPFEHELGSALLQFLATVSEAGLLACVQRCHGVQTRGDAQIFLTADFETAFAARAGLEQLVENRRGGSPWRQCPVLIFSKRGRHFCSKACSNATFAARKALEDPQYFAVKQERYRSKQAATNSRPAPRGEGAFVYMD